MFVSAFAAMVLFAAPEAVQPVQTAAPETKSTEAAAAPKKICYTATPSGSRMPRKVCVTQSAKGEDKADRAPAKAPETKAE